ncbi:MAG: type IV secretory system conjugative DNA transfer family protein, partial [Candidatus Dormibacter sp.]
LRPLRVRGGAPGSLILGRRGAHLIATQPETSVLVIGPTRSGKTSGLVVPNLLEWRGPAVVTSTKSELVDITAAHRARGGEVCVYDPTAETGRPDTVSWSPLAGCENLDTAWTVAAWLCAGLQQGGARTDNDWAHWAESGKLLIAPLLYAAAASQRSIVDVRDWIHRFDLDTPAALIESLAAPHPVPDADPARALAMLASIDQRPEKERGTVFSTVMRHLQRLQRARGGGVRAHVGVRPRSLPAGARHPVPLHAPPGAGADRLAVRGHPHDRGHPCVRAGRAARTDG